MTEMQITIASAIFDRYTTFDVSKDGNAKMGRSDFIAAVSEWEAIKAEAQEFKCKLESSVDIQT
jgi:hypothetical protein